MIRVLLVDDQALVRSGIRIILDSEPDITVVGEAENGELAVTAAAALMPDVICMDVEMPVLGGIAATERIVAGASAPEGVEADAAQGPRPAVLMLTTFGHEAYVFDALAAGASGFLLKTSRAEQLIDAVRALAAGGSLLSPEVTGAVLERVRGAGPTPEPSASPEPSAAELSALDRAIADVGLTERERVVLAELAQGCTNAEIAAALFLGEATVKTHVSNVLQKLGVRDRLQAVVWAHTRS